MSLCVWLAVVGVVLKGIVGTRYQGLSTCLYLAMGWLVVVAAEPLLLHLAPSTLQWLIAGGIAYTVGVVFFALDERVRYAHFAWHLFVVAGTERVTLDGEMLTRGSNRDYVFGGYRRIDLLTDLIQ